MKKLMVAAVAAILSFCGASASDALISGSGPEVFTSFTTNVRSYAFAGHRSVKKISLPAAVEVGPAAFIGCRLLEYVELPRLQDVSGFNGIFSGCPNLVHVDLSSVRFDPANRGRFPWGVTNPDARFYFINGCYQINGTPAR